jgi:hypothetical protein
MDAVEGVLEDQRKRMDASDRLLTDHQEVGFAAQGVLESVRYSITQDMMAADARLDKQCEDLKLRIVCAEGLLEAISQRSKAACAKLEQ